MKIEKFATEQLSKKDMNELKGGAHFYCKCLYGKITWEGNYDAVYQMEEAIAKKCASVGGNGTCNQYATDL